MRPALEVHWDRVPGAEDAYGLGRSLARERQICALELLRPLNGAREQDRNINGTVCLSDAAHDIERSVVARHIDGVRSGRMKKEADHGPHRVVTSVGTVLGWNRGDGDRAASLGWDLHRCKGLDADGVGAETLGASRRREHTRGAWEEAPSVGVQVVGVLVVGEQDNVDWLELVGVERRAGGLLQPAIAAWRGQGGISQPAQAGVFEQDRWSPDQLSGNRAHRTMTRWGARASLS
jgi:hypothetical protein